MTTRRRSPASRALAWTAALVVIASAVWLAGLFYFVSLIPTVAEGRAAARGAPRQTDAIVVLTGGSGRLEAGLQLLAAGHADTLFVSGVAENVDVAALVGSDLLDGAGLRCCIVLGHAANDTRGNARETAQWMAARDYGSLRLVTANYHMPRSLLEFRAVMPDAEIVPYPVHSANVRLAQWWRWPGTAALLAGEYVKYLAAHLRQVVRA